ncbi:MAG: hypothetical protein LUI87_10820, partial [Lachnospiraceae bacterium]|nr:hypothetical protein [Lachnospiraceae bacterium]
RVVYAAVDGKAIIQELDGMEKTPARFDWLLKTLSEKYELSPEQCIRLAEFLLRNASLSSGSLLAAWTGYKKIRNIE